MRSPRSRIARSRTRTSATSSWSSEPNSDEQSLTEVAADGKRGRLVSSGLAQLVEQAAVNRRVAGSSPAAGATIPEHFRSVVRTTDR